MQCNNQDCSCQEVWEQKTNNHIIVYCDYYQSGAHCKTDEDPVRWNIICPIPRSTFDMAIVKAMPELKKFKQWREEQDEEKPF